MLVRGICSSTELAQNLHTGTPRVRVCGAVQQQRSAGQHKTWGERLHFGKKGSIPAHTAHYSTWTATGYGKNCIINIVFCPFNMRRLRCNVDALIPVRATPPPMNATNTDCHENSIRVLLCQEVVIITDKEQTKLQGLDPVKCAAEFQIQNGWQGARLCSPLHLTWKQQPLGSRMQMQQQ